MDKVKLPIKTTKMKSFEVTSTRECRPTKVTQSCASCRSKFTNEKWGIVMTERGSKRLCGKCFGKI